jgi:hypothetical protein
MMKGDEEQGSHNPEEHRPKKKGTHVIFSLVLLLIVLVVGCCYGYFGLTPNYAADFDDGFSGRQVLEFRYTSSRC